MSTVMALKCGEGEKKAWCLGRVSTHTHIKSLTDCWTDRQTYTHTHTRARARAHTHTHTDRQTNRGKTDRHRARRETDRQTDR